jgi:hypothetical protein
MPLCVAGRAPKKRLAENLLREIVGEEEIPQTEQEALERFRSLCSDAKVCSTPSGITEFGTAVFRNGS